MSASTAPRRPSLRMALGPTALLLVTVVGLLAVVWGAFNPPDVTVVYVDAGPVSQFDIGRVQAYPNDFYVVGLEDGRLRALDGRIVESGCTARWLPNDRRGVEHNPMGRAGVFEDPCTGAIWSMIGNAISGTSEPMRTPHIDPRRSATGEMHLFVEVITAPPAR